MASLKAESIAARKPRLIHHNGGVITYATRTGWWNFWKSSNRKGLPPLMMLSDPHGRCSDDDVKNLLTALQSANFDPS